MLNWIVQNKTDYLHKNGFGINNLQRLICHKNQLTDQPRKQIEKPKVVVKNREAENKTNQYNK